MSSGLIPVHWIQWTNQMSSAHVPVHWIQWTTEISNGHMHVQWSIGSNGPLDILALLSHWPSTCMGSMPTYDVIRDNLLNAQPNVKWTGQPNVQWTTKCRQKVVHWIQSSHMPNGHFICPLDICFSIGSYVHWTFALVLDMYEIFPCSSIRKPLVACL